MTEDSISTSGTPLIALASSLNGYRSRRPIPLFVPSAARHAVSLDERRGRFKPNLWGRSPNPLVDMSPAVNAKDKEAQGDRKSSSQEEVQQVFEKIYSENARTTDVEEVWFSVSRHLYVKPEFMRISFI